MTAAGPAFAILALTQAAVGQDSVPSRPTSLMEGKTFTTEWREAPEWEPETEVDVGSASGHGGNLRWIRLRPAGEEVEVLNLEYQGRSLGRKAPPAVTAKLGRLSRSAYAEVLHDLVRIEAARLVREPPSRSRWSTTGDFWASIRIARGDAVRFEDEWCGYPNSTDEARYAKVAAAVARVQSAVRDAEAASHEPTAEERLWASGRFIRDWKRHEGRGGGYRWVRERSPLLVASVGDDASLGVLDSFTVVHVRVHDGDGMPLPHASVQVSWSWPGLFRRRTLAAVPRFGDATLSVLIGEPGGYELEVRGDGFQAKKVPLTVGRRSPQEVVVDLERVPGSK
ncbi:MAG: carboxypeptidase-like regulatory domain-containing protein [Planctomycetes bacterium]|nr:carboxypeptidase-like regulatory domain-containing protein [Planctomycetota bacterium]